MSEMKNKPFPKNKKMLFSIIMVLLSFFLILFFGEIMLRGYRYFQGFKIPVKTMVPDSELGWKAAENYYFKGNIKDAKGQPYLLELSTDANGFRRYDDINSTKKKILFIGDSFSHAIEVSNDKTYYHVLGDSLDAAVFAYGCGGYGTLQEWMVLEKYFDRIDPDMVVLQFCSNDFINNSYELESNSFFNNSRLTGPYLTPDEKTIYKNTSRFHFPTIKRFSQLIPFVFTRIERAIDHKNHKAQKSSEDLIFINGEKYEPFQEAIVATENIIKKIQNLVEPKAELVLFSVDYFDPCTKAIKNICDRNKIKLIESVPYYLKLKMDEGKNVYAADGAHWNEQGHQVVADVLMEEIFKDN